MTSRRDVIKVVRPPGRERCYGDELILTMARPLSSIQRQNVLTDLASSNSRFKCYAPMAILEYRFEVAVISW